MGAEERKTAEQDRQPMEQENDRSIRRQGAPKAEPDDKSRGEHPPRREEPEEPAVQQGGREGGQAGQSRAQ